MGLGNGGHDGGVCDALQRMFVVMERMRRIRKG